MLCIAHTKGKCAKEARKYENKITNEHKKKKNFINKISTDSISFMSKTHTHIIEMRKSLVKNISNGKTESSLKKRFFPSILIQLLLYSSTAIIFDDTKRTLSLSIS
jgi:hypothetical protein